MHVDESGSLSHAARTLLYAVTINSHYGVISSNVATPTNPCSWRTVAFHYVVAPASIELLIVKSLSVFNIIV